MTNTFPIFVSYAQIAVFESHLEKPFNNWNDNHYKQGFSWRKGSVSFAVPDGGDCLVEVSVGTNESQIVGETTREIMVPFEVTTTPTSFASIGDEKTFLIESGLYQLTFELIPSVQIESEKYDYAIRLLFSKEASPVFKIIKGDAEMDVSAELDLDAAPAN
jgi:hypothetical protein